MQSRTMLITGATSGIGRAIALEMAQRGYTVFATGRRKAALQELDNASEHIVALPLDVTDSTSITQVKEEILRQTNNQGVDILVNNAGFGVYGPLLDISDESLRQQFEVNVFGMVAVTRAFAKPMMARRQGRIINISSVAGRFTLPFAGPYIASKFALEALSDTMRMEMAPFNVKVVILEPGLIRTNFLESAYDVSPALRSQTSPFAPYLKSFERLVDPNYANAPGPEVIASTVAKIAATPSPRARYVVPWQNVFAILFLRHLLPTWFQDALARLILEWNATRVEMTPDSDSQAGSTNITNTTKVSFSGEYEE
jgi:NAD(P)-dependent dehydrogenase (short-subunit alcohol dehydrogenase family)